MNRKETGLLLGVILLMVVVLVGGWFGLQYYSTLGKEKVLFSTVEYESNYLFTEDDKYNFESKLISVEDLPNKNYITNFEKQILGNKTSGPIEKGMILYTSNFIKKEGMNVEESGPAYSVYDNAVQLPIVIGAENSIAVDGALEAGKTIDIYAYTKYVDSITDKDDAKFGKVSDYNFYISKIEDVVNEDNNTMNQIVTVTSEKEAITVLLALSNDSNTTLLFLEKEEGVEMDGAYFSDIFYNITGQNPNGKEEFVLTSEDFIKLSQRTIEDGFVHPWNITFFDKEVDLVWRGKNLQSIYLEHYNFDGTRGENYGEFASYKNNVLYDETTDEYRLDRMLGEGVYILTTNESMIIEVEDPDNKDKTIEKEFKRTADHIFIVETETKEWKADPVTHIYTCDKSSYRTVGNLNFKKEYFENVKYLENFSFGWEDLSNVYDESFTLCFKFGEIFALAGENPFVKNHPDDVKTTKLELTNAITRYLLGFEYDKYKTVEEKMKELNQKIENATTENEKEKCIEDLNVYKENEEVKHLLAFSPQIDKLFEIIKNDYNIYATNVVEFNGFIDGVKQTIEGLYNEGTDNFQENQKNAYRSFVVLCNKYFFGIDCFGVDEENKDADPIFIDNGEDNSIFFANGELSTLYDFIIDNEIVCEYVVNDDVKITINTKIDPSWS